MSSVWRTFDSLVDFAHSDTYLSTFHVMACGIRADGVRVISTNGAAKFPSSERLRIKIAHAEQRIARKLDKGSVVYVARVLRNGAYAMAKPCDSCQRILKSRKVAKVFYTIAPKHFGVLEF